MVEENHALREQMMALQEENMELSREVANGDTARRKNTATVARALEGAARDYLRNAHSSIRKELFEQMDQRTRHMVSPVLGPRVKRVPGSLVGNPYSPVCAHATHPHLLPHTTAITLWRSTPRGGARAWQQPRAFWTNAT
jgi:hypothetical protein